MNPNDQSFDDSENFTVERILDKRIEDDGHVCYYIKWAGFNDSENTWEPEENCCCPELIAEFESKLKPCKNSKKFKRRDKKLKERKTPVFTKNSFAINKEDDDEDEEPSHHLQHGRIPKEILGVTDQGGVLRFLMKWDGSEKASFVFASEVNKAFPQLVIDYYESKLKFHWDGLELNC